jgi:hypothetical protein
VLRDVVTELSSTVRILGEAARIPRIPQYRQLSSTDRIGP